MKAYGISEKGKYRLENQDSILIRHQGGSGLMIVADGVGGSFAGGEVSRYLTGEYGRWWERMLPQLNRYGFTELFDSARTLAEELNANVCAARGVGRSGSTLALLLIHDSVFGCLSVGDSRIYRYDRFRFRCLTRDDILGNLPGKSMDSPDSGKLVSAVGGFETLDYSSMTDRCSSGTVFLLCSDGIYRYAEPDVMKASLRGARYAPFLSSRYLERIVESAVRQDTKDNYSAVLVKI